MALCIRNAIGDMRRVAPLGASGRNAPTAIIWAWRGLVPTSRGGGADKISRVTNVLLPAMALRAGSSSAGLKAGNGRGEPLLTALVRNVPEHHVLDCCCNS